jgi:hypothetical protein
MSEWSKFGAPVLMAQIPPRAAVHEPPMSAETLGPGNHGVKRRFKSRRGPLDGHLGAHRKGCLAALRGLLHELTADGIGPEER